MKSMIAAALLIIFPATASADCSSVRGATATMLSAIEGLNESLSVADLSVLESVVLPQDVLAVSKAEIERQALVEQMDAFQAEMNNLQSALDRCS